jgi:hypothetical protein
MADDRDAWVELPRACFATDPYDDSAPYVVRLYPVHPGGTGCARCGMSG